MSRMGSTQTVGPSYNSGVSSDDESAILTDALAAPRVPGVNINGLHELQVKLLEASDDEGSLEGTEDDEDWDELETALEENLGELDDQYLFQGGEFNPKLCHISR